MAILGAYLKDDDRNNMLLQRTIRDIDERDFIAALAGMDEASRQALYRNISRRAYESIYADLAEKEASLGPQAIQAGVAEFLRILAMHERHAAIMAPEPGEYRHGTGSIAALRSNLLIIAQACLEDDFALLERLRADEGDALMRDGIRMALDGTDPLAARGRLERRRELLLAAMGRRMDMAIEAFDCILSGESVGQTAERIEPFVDDD
ncbi:MAG TPA: hypothetical protein DCG47_01970 [Spirochaetaceae bacterium]|jgi:hypothetical protein|nr:hypothetical protein [Spirochaetaceae bacterium]